MQSNASFSPVSTSWTQRSKALFCIFLQRQKAYFSQILIITLPKSVWVRPRSQAMGQERGLHRLTDFRGQMLPLDGVWFSRDAEIPWGPSLSHSSTSIAWFCCTVVHVARICTWFLEAEHIPGVRRPADWADMSATEHVREALDGRLRQRLPLYTATEEEWAETPQATINNSIDSRWVDQAGVALCEPNVIISTGFLTTHYSKTEHFIVSSAHDKCCIWRRSGLCLGHPRTFTCSAWSTAVVLQRSQVCCGNR